MNDHTLVGACEQLKTSFAQINTLNARKRRPAILYSWKKEFMNYRFSENKTPNDYMYITDNTGCLYIIKDVILDGGKLFYSCTLISRNGMPQQTETMKATKHLISLDAKDVRVRMFKNLIKDDQILIKAKKFPDHKVGDLMLISTIIHDNSDVKESLHNLPFFPILGTVTAEVAVSDDGFKFIEIQPHFCSFNPVKLENAIKIYVNEYNEIHNISTIDKINPVEMPMMFKLVNSMLHEFPSRYGQAIINKQAYDEEMFEKEVIDVKSDPVEFTHEIQKVKIGDAFGIAQIRQDQLDYCSLSSISILYEKLKDEQLMKGYYVNFAPRVFERERGYLNSAKTEEEVLAFNKSFKSIKEKLDTEYQRRLKQQEEEQQQAESQAQSTLQQQPPFRTQPISNSNSTNTQSTNNTHAGVNSSNGTTQMRKPLHQSTSAPVPVSQPSSNNTGNGSTTNNSSNGTTQMRKPLHQSTSAPVPVSQPSSNNTGNGSTNNNTNSSTKNTQESIPSNKNTNKSSSSNDIMKLINNFANIYGDSVRDMRVFEKSDDLKKNYWDVEESTTSNSFVMRDPISEVAFFDENRSISFIMNVLPLKVTKFTINDQKLQRYGIILEQHNKIATVIDAETQFEVGNTLDCRDLSYYKFLRSTGYICITNKRGDRTTICKYKIDRNRFKDEVPLLLCCNLYNIETKHKTIGYVIVEVEKTKNSNTFYTLNSIRFLVTENS